MVAPAILFVLLLCFLAFFLWDRKRLSNPTVQPMSRERMEKGFTPTEVLGWPVTIGLGFVALALAFAEWQSPTQRPYSGRWAWFYEATFQVFGSNGVAGVLLIAGLVAIGYGCIRWLKSR